MATRFSAQFDSRLSSILAKLAKEKGTTKNEILRRAVATYDFLEKEIKEDKTISVTTKDNQIVKQLIIP